MSIQIIHDQYSELNTIIYNTRFPITAMEHLMAQNPLASPPLNTSSTSEPSGHGITNLGSTPLSPSSAIHSPRPQRDLTSPRLSETAEVTVYPSSVSLRVCINMKKLNVVFSPNINDEIS